MQEELMLVLSVYEGEGIQPREGWTVVVTARLDGLVLATDPVPLTTEPKFRQEISWNLNTATLRKYKRARVPVRVECHAVDNHENHQMIGYIVLPLSTAVKGINIDPKWHKLLGGPTTRHKLSPSLLLCLNVLPSASTTKKDEVMTVNDDSNCAETDNKSALDMDVDSHHASPQQPDVINKENSIKSGQRVKVLSSDSRINSKFSDGKVRSDSNGKQKLSSSREEEVKVVVEDCAMRVAEKKTINNSSYSRRSVGSHWMEDKTREVKECYITQEYGHEKEDSDDPQKILNREGFDICSNYRRLSDVTHSSNNAVSVSATSIPQHHPVNVRKDFTQSHPTDISRRVSQPYSNDNNGLRKANKRCDTQGSSSIVRENGHKFAQHTSSSNLALAIPSTSNTAGGKSRMSTDSTQIIPRLNQNGGFFQIGPVGEPDEKMFHFSVTIVYAKNLDEVFPKDFEVAETDKMRFCYSLLGHIVYTDPIKDLINPQFLAERAAGKVCSTFHSVSTYFKQHPELPIHLLIGDVCLATSSINLSSFEAVDSLTPETPLTIEGNFPLVPVMMNPLVWSPAKKPVLGGTIQLSISADHEGSSIHYPPMVKENFDNGSSVLMVDYLSSSSSSGGVTDSEEEYTIAWSNQDDGVGVYTQEGEQNRYKVKRRRHKQRDLPGRWRHQRKSLMYEAAMEVETWKENQQRFFWKQWSAREAELQHHLASEWQARISTMEAQLQRRLDQCDTLHRRLTEALANVTVKEKNIALREEKVRMLQEEVERKEHELHGRERMLRKVEKRSKKVRESQETRELREQLAHEKMIQRHLQRQVRELEAASRAAGDTAEAAQLGGQVKMQEIENLKRDKEYLAEQLSAALRRKKYYKLQWVQSIGQVHHLKTSPVCHANDLRLEMERSSPQPYYVHQQPNKRLKYKEENHTVYDAGEKGRDQVKGSELRQNSDMHCGMEPAKMESNERVRWKKGMGPGKSSEPRKVLEDLVKERQDLDRLVRKRNSLVEAEESSSHYSAAIREAETKIRSLVDG
ncbi:uncharacterized protein [Panulirus ornatus]|uniref:uncharacterized protein n=1 Tax=Panulirus ornatus TaxID=150431 RepID=UPI003A85BAF2